MSSILIFYGFSGNQRSPVPAFPGGTDHDLSFKLVAETMRDSLVKAFPADTVTVTQAWTKDRILTAIESASEPVAQVHVMTHGLNTRLSLAYHYNHDARLKALAQKWNAAPGSELARARGALREEDALVAGLFEQGLDPARRTALAAKHAPGAVWQIWGCYAGYDFAVFEGDLGDPDIDPYLERFNLGMASRPSVAQDIATGLGVICTAARDGAGLEFWHGNAARQVKRNGRTTRDSKPYWLWNTTASRWVSFDASAAELPKPVIFGQERDAADLPTPKPPKWLTDLYWA